MLPWLGVIVSVIDSHDNVGSHARVELVVLIQLTGSGERSRTDFHPEFQQIASVYSDTGEFQEERLGDGEEAEKFYRALAGQKVQVAVEASGHARWVERLLAERRGYPAWSILYRLARTRVRMRCRRSFAQSCPRDSGLIPIQLAGNRERSQSSRRKTLRFDPSESSSTRWRPGFCRFAATRLGSSSRLSSIVLQYRQYA